MTVLNGIAGFAGTTGYFELVRYLESKGQSNAPSGKGRLQAITLTSKGLESGLHASLTSMLSESRHVPRLPLQLHLFNLLILCCSCHRLKTGNGKWTKRVVQVYDYPGTDFSHGICPSCFRRLYPKIYKQRSGF